MWPFKTPKKELPSTSMAQDTGYYIKGEDRLLIVLTELKYAYENLLNKKEPPNATAEALFNYIVEYNLELWRIYKAMRRPFLRTGDRGSTGELAKLLNEARALYDFFYIHTQKILTTNVPNAEQTSESVAIENTLKMQTVQNFRIYSTWINSKIEDMIDLSFTDADIVNPKTLFLQSNVMLNNGVPSNALTTSLGNRSDSNPRQRVTSQNTENNRVSNVVEA